MGLQCQGGTIFLLASIEKRLAERRRTENNRCYLYPQNNKDIQGWAKRLMEEKGITFNDEWNLGTAKTVVLKYHRK